MLLMRRFASAVDVDDNDAIVGGSTTSRLSEVIDLVNGRHRIWVEMVSLMS